MLYLSLIIIHPTLFSYSIEGPPSQYFVVYSIVDILITWEVDLAQYVVASSSSSSNIYQSVNKSEDA